MKFTFEKPWVQLALPVLLLLGCAQQSDPFADHNEYKQMINSSVPEKDFVQPAPKPQPAPPKNTEDEEIISANANDVFPAPVLDDKELIFHESEEKSYTLSLPVHLRGMDCEIVLDDAPEGMVLKHLDAEKYELKWKPEGVLDAGTKSQILTIVLRLSGKKFKTEKVFAAYEAAVKTRELEITVKGSGE